MVAVATAIAGLAQVVINMGLSRAAIQIPILTQPVQSALWLVNLAMGLLVMVAMLLSAPSFARLYGDIRLTGVFVAVATIPALLGVQVQSRVVLIRSHQFGRLAGAEAAGSLVSVAGAVTMAVAGAGYWAIVALPIVYAAVSSVAVLIMARWLPSRLGDWVDVRRVVASGTRIAGTAILENSGRFFLIPVIAMQLPTAAVGQFDRAQQVAMFPHTSVLNQLQRVGIPLFSTISGSSERVGRAWLEVQSLFLLAVGLFYVTLAVTSRDVILIVLGPGWLVAGKLLGILAIVALARTLALVPQWILIGCGYSTGLLRMSIIAQPLIFGCSLIGLLGGALGVAIASALANAFYLPVLFWYVSRKIGVSLRPMAKHVVWLTATVLLPSGILAAALSRISGSPIASILLAGCGVTLVISTLLVVSRSHRLLFAGVRQQIAALRGVR